MTSALNGDITPPRVAVLDADGRISRVWWQFFYLLLQRTGGRDMGDQDPLDWKLAPADWQARVADLEAQIEHLARQQQSLFSRLRTDFDEFAVTPRACLGSVASQNVENIFGVFNERAGDVVASAATINLDVTTGNIVEISGTTDISTITLAAGRERIVRFQGALKVTYDAVLIQTLDSADIKTAAGDLMWVRGYVDGANIGVRVELFQRKKRHGADITAASTINLDLATGDLVDVTGNTGISTITLADGREVTVRFTGTPTLTHGASLVLPGAANITVAAGDYMIFRGYASGVVRCVVYGSSAAPYIASGVAITGGTINNTTIGATTPASIKGTTIQATSANGFKSSDASQGISTTVTTGSLVGKTITFKDGLVTDFS